MLLTIVEESLPISLNSFGFVWEDVGGGDCPAHRVGFWGKSCEMALDVFANSLVMVDDC